MLTGQPPWKDRNLQSLIQLHFLLSTWEGSPPYPYSNIPTIARECIDSCFFKKEKERPSAKELLGCAFLIETDLEESLQTVHGRRGEDSVTAIKSNKNDCESKTYNNTSTSENDRKDWNENKTAKLNAQNEADDKDGICSREKGSKRQENDEEEARGECTLDDSGVMLELRQQLEKARAYAQDKVKLKMTPISSLDVGTNGKQVTARDETPEHTPTGEKVNNRQNEAEIKDNDVDIRYRFGKREISDAPPPRYIELMHFIISLDLFLCLPYRLPTPSMTPPHIPSAPVTPSNPYARLRNSNTTPPSPIILECDRVTMIPPSLSSDFCINIGKTRFPTYSPFTATAAFATANTAVSSSIPYPLPCNTKLTTNDPQLSTNNTADISIHLVGRPLYQQEFGPPPLPSPSSHTIPPRPSIIIGKSPIPANSIVKGKDIANIASSSLSSSKVSRPYKASSDALPLKDPSGHSSEEAHGTGSSFTGISSARDSEGLTPAPTVNQTSSPIWTGGGGEKLKVDTIRHQRGKTIITSGSSITATAGKIGNIVKGKSINRKSTYEEVIKDEDQWSCPLPCNYLNTFDTSACDKCGLKKGGRTLERERGGGLSQIAVTSTASTSVIGTTDMMIKVQTLIQ